jgi:hypothetical protein
MAQDTPVRPLSRDLGGAWKIDAQAWGRTS